MGEQTEADVSMHDCAQGGIAVLQAPKGRTASSTAVPLTVLVGTTVRLCTAARAPVHGRAPLVFRDIWSGFNCFGGSFRW